VGQAYQGLGQKGPPFRCAVYASSTAQTGSGPQGRVQLRWRRASTAPTMGSLRRMRHPARSFTWDAALNGANLVTAAAYEPSRTR
jgi:hypothetical protein